MVFFPSSAPTGVTMDWDRLGLTPLLENPIAVQAASLAALIIAS
jgi:hypothetical protein